MKRIFKFLLPKQNPTETLNIMPKKATPKKNSGNSEEEILLWYYFKKATSIKKDGHTSGYTNVSTIGNYNEDNEDDDGE